MHGDFLYYIKFTERKKIMHKKLFCSILSVILAMGMLSLTAFASDDITVSLRIEGIEDCLFYDDISVEAGASVYDALLKADELDDTITVTSSQTQYGAYITAVNEITAGTYTAKKWDGWLFRVNEESPSVGVDAFTLTDGDVIVIYYGDPYNTGMQYPIVDFDAENGTFTLTSLDTVYDELWNPVTQECPIAGYTLVWEISDGKTAEITADENGVAVIPEEYLTYGSHNVGFEKTAENGLPLILRVAPDFSVEIPDNRNIFEKLFDAIMNFFTMITNFFKSIFE